MMMDYTVSSAMSALHKTNELTLAHMFERRKPGLFHNRQDSNVMVFVSLFIAYVSGH